MYYCYILQNKSNKLYIGVTNNLEDRLKRHNSGHGANYTSVLKDYRIVYIESYSTLSEARNREIQIKKWSRKNKLALIAGEFNNLKVYSKSSK